MDESIYELVERLVSPVKRGGRLSSIDWATIDAWLQAGVTPECIESAIERGVVQLKKNNGTVGSVAYFSELVYKAQWDVQ